MLQPFNVGKGMGYALGSGSSVRQFVNVATRSCTYSARRQEPFIRLVRDRYRLDSNSCMRGIVRSMTRLDNLYLYRSSYSSV